jgi:hypothetical protein
MSFCTPIKRSGHSDKEMHMNNKEKILWITRTAIFTALLIVIQATTASLGNTLITGTFVNLILIVSTMTCGLASGLTIAVISPVMAKLVGIGPLWVLIPFIAAGNIALALFWNFAGNKNLGRKYAAYAIALVTAAVAKFLVLYIGIARISVPLFLNLPDQQALIVSHMFSIPQLITALAGGVIAAIILPPLKRAIKAQ